MSDHADLNLLEDSLKKQVNIVYDQIKDEVNIGLPESRFYLIGKLHGLKVAQYYIHRIRSGVFI